VDGFGTTGSICNTMHLQQMHIKTNDANTIVEAVILKLPYSKQEQSLSIANTTALIPFLMETFL
jgi:hypothetical protein